MSESSPVKVRVRSFAEFFGDSPLPVAVDTYQRGYEYAMISAFDKYVSNLEKGG